jgi:hypothetical protein
MITALVYHYLVTAHHGSHYDWHIWDDWYLAYQAAPKLNAPSAAVKRVLAILAAGGI